MKPAYYKTIIIVIIISLILPLSGCNEELRGSDIYGASLFGALVGGIIGHQSDKKCEGAAIGAAVLGVGELLHQLDNIESKDKKDSDKDDGGRKEIYVIQVRNSNGSITPIEIEKKGDIFIGPKGEHYEALPTEKQLQPVYGF